MHLLDVILIDLIPNNNYEALLGITQENGLMLVWVRSQGRIIKYMRSRVHANYTNIRVYSENVLVSNRSYFLMVSQ